MDWILLIFPLVGAMLGVLWFFVPRWMKQWQKHKKDTSSAPKRTETD